MHDIIANRETLTITRDKWRDPFSGRRWRSHIRSWRMLFTFRRRRPEHWLVLRAGNFPDLLKTGALVCTKMEPTQRRNAADAQKPASAQDAPDEWARQAISEIGLGDAVPPTEAQGFFDGAEAATRVSNDNAAAGESRAPWIAAWRGGSAVAGACPFEEIRLLERSVDGHSIDAATLKRIAEALRRGDEEVRIDVRNKGELALRPDRAGVMCALEDGHLRFTVPSLSDEAAAVVAALNVAAEIAAATDMAEAIGLHELHLPTDSLSAVVAGSPARQDGIATDEKLKKLCGSIKAAARRHRLFFWPEEPRILSADIGWTPSSGVMTGR